jgi:WXG100 family type VII secretion target
MTVIRIDPGEVTATGTQFHSKRGELEGMIQQARGLMNSLRGQFTGQRANTIFGEWEGMQPRLTAAVETLQMAGDLLRRASEDFAAVDSRR